MQLDDLNTSSGRSIPVPQTNAGHDKRCSRSLCISRPQHIQGKMLYYNAENTKSITLDGEAQHYQLTEGSIADVKSRSGKTRAAFLRLKNMEFETTANEYQGQNLRYKRKDSSTLRS
ncbi:unnamed protein product [Schistosoma curassoni]|uniref:Uncharacterized protein n=1 Tax=Schistosoma curassoni TaxID=6186 RepID=A0A183JG16_9TREM|nr:unnamed protein product [Schistosoma curassoni]